MNCIAFGATTKWAFPFVAPVVDRLRSVWSLRWGSTGMWSISCVPSVRSLSWVIDIMRSEAWPTVRRIIISSSEICVSFAIRSLEAMVCKIGILIIVKLTNIYIFSLDSIYCSEQGVVRASLCLLCVRYENDAEIEILRVRREARVQEML